MTCVHCGREGPDGRFCTWCGRQQSAEASAGGRRRFAAAPNESVVAPSLMTTVFPHLAERGVNEFRWGLGAGLAVLLALYIAGLITAALVVAAILVPALYVMYLYEARVYRDAPIPVTLGTIGGGFLVGIIATIALDALVGNRQAESGAEGSIDVARLLLVATFLPLVREAVKPLPALLLRNRREFGQSVDGLVFGIAAGLGFAAAETIIHFSAVITGLPPVTEPGLWILPLITVGILTPLLHGSSTGLITAALWRYRPGKPIPRLTVPVIAAAVGGQVAFTLGTTLLEASPVSPIVEVLWQAVVVVAVLVVVRIVLDQLLREEAAEFGLRQLTCPNCGAEITAGGFCTVCGVALAATPQPRAAGVTARRPTPGEAR